MNIEKIAKRLGLTWDGDENDNRLFDDDNQIVVHAPALGRNRYEEMEKEVSDFYISKPKYDIFAFSDVSGFDYWNEDTEYNYIQIYTRIKKYDLTDTDFNDILNDIDVANNIFSGYGI